MKLDWFKDMELFVAVANAKSFIGASNALDIPHSTISRRITAFEKSLGFQLLNRTTRRVELTNDGAAYLARIERIVEDINEIHTELSEHTQQPQGHLRISIPPSLIEFDMGSWLAEFAKLYPKVTFDIDTSPVQVNLIAEKYDVAIRIGTLQDSSLVVRRLTLLQRALFVSPLYIQKYGKPNHPEDLIQHDCLRLSGSPHETIWHLVKGKETHAINVKGRFWFNDPFIEVELALQGLGIAALGEIVSQPYITSGKLLRVLPDWQLKPIVISAVTSSRFQPAKTRALIEFIRQKIDKTD